MVHLLFATPLGLAASLRPDGFVSGAVSFVRRTLARSVFLGFQIGVPRCKRRISVNRVDLVKSFQTSIYFSVYLQNLASIQPRTCLSKFAKHQPKVRKQVTAHTPPGLGLRARGGPAPGRRARGDPRLLGHHRSSVEL